MILQHFFQGHGGGAPPGFGKAQPSVQRERGRVIRRNLHGTDGKAARLHGEATPRLRIAFETAMP